MNRSLSFLAFLITLPSWALPAAGADPDPAAMERLRALAAAYQTLPAYSDQGKLTSEVKIGGAVKSTESVVSITVIRPNKLKITTPLVEVASDGKNVVTTVPSLKSYFKTAAPTKLTHNDLTEGPLGSYERGGSSGIPCRVLLTLLLDEHPVEALMRDATGVSVAKDVNRDGVTYSALKLESDVAPNILLLIDPKSKLVASIEVELAERTTPDSAVPGVDVALGSMRWSAGKIATDKVASVEIKPAAGFKEIVSLDQTETEKTEHQLVGKPAPDFMVNVLATDGKTRRMGLKDLEGKVVLLDFWATWCGPCRKEMPDLARLSDEVAKAKKPVVFLAVSVDQPEEADLSGLEKKVATDIKTLGFDPEKASSRLVGFDPSGSVSRGYGVNAIPTLVLIDGKGIVRAVHVGVTEHDVLSQQIEAILSGKPISSK